MLGKIPFETTLTLQSLLFSIACFFVFRFSLFFLVRFSFFSRILGVPRREKRLPFSGFPLVFFNKARVGGSGKAQNKLVRSFLTSEVHF